MADLCERRAPTFSRCAAASAWTADRRQVPERRPGYGGSCFPKDTIALVRTARDAGAPVELVETTVKVNDERKRPWPQGRQGAGRRSDGQDRRRAGPDLQAQHRRHARRALAGIIPALQARAPRCRPSTRRATRRRQLLQGVDFKDDPYARRRGRRRAGDHHRMGPVPRAGSWDRIKSLIEQPAVWWTCATSTSRRMKARGFAYTQRSGPPVRRTPQQDVAPGARSRARGHQPAPPRPAAAPRPRTCPGGQPGRRRRRHSPTVPKKKSAAFRGESGKASSRHGPALAIVVQVTATSGGGTEQRHEQPPRAHWPAASPAGVSPDPDRAHASTTPVAHRRRAIATARRPCRRRRAAPPSARCPRPTRPASAIAPP
jgi:hypothetical protein